MPLMKAHRPNFHMVTAWISKDSTEPEATEFGEWKVSVLTQRPDKKKKRKGKCPNESYISREGHGTHPRDWDKRMGGGGGRTEKSRIPCACSWDSGRPRAASGCVGGVP